MYLKAISIGDAVPHADFDAAVHSVFRSAINLSPGVRRNGIPPHGSSRSLSPGGQTQPGVRRNGIPPHGSSRSLSPGGQTQPGGESNLLTLVASSEADLPQGIRVDTPEDFSFESGALRAGEPAACRDELLRFGSLTIDLRGARRWKCDLPSLRADLTDLSVETAWRSVWDALNQRQVQWNAEIIAQDLFRSDETLRAGAPRKAGAAMRGLLDATRRTDLAAPASVRALIGLGSGLTPSGDDLLVGYLAGLWCAVRNSRERTLFISSLGETVIRLSQRTNAISRTYLYHAARGQVSSRLADLAEAICRGENFDRLLTTAESAMQVGHTSGMDAVTGLLIGLVVWSQV